MIVPIILAAAVAGPFASELPEAQRLAVGRALVEKNCSACHATGLAGDSPNPRAPKFRELGKRYPVDNLAESLAEGIYVGHPEMPQFILNGDDADNIVAYLKSLQRPAKQPVR